MEKMPSSSASLDRRDFALEVMLWNGLVWHQCITSFSMLESCNQKIKRSKDPFVCVTMRVLYLGPEPWPKMIPEALLFVLL